MGNDDSDDTAWSERLERCANCGSKLPMEEWRPIATSTDSDGGTQVLTFCDDSCKEAWLTENRDGEDDR